MARLVQRDTGSVVNIPDEDAAAVLALGHYDELKGDPPKSRREAARDFRRQARATESTSTSRPAKKATAKKASSSKSSK